MSFDLPLGTLARISSNETGDQWDAVLIAPSSSEGRRWRAVTGIGLHAPEDVTVLHIDPATLRTEAKAGMQVWLLMVISDGETFANVHATEAGALAEQDRDLRLKFGGDDEFMALKTHDERATFAADYWDYHSWIESTTIQP